MSRDNKDSVKRVLRAAEEKGCTVELRRGGHYKITTPAGSYIFCSQTPSDFRGVKRTISILRRHGVDVDAS